MALSIPSVLQIDEVIKAQMEDQLLSRMRATIKDNPSSYSGYTLVEEVLLYKDRITLPKDSPWVLLALQEGHDRKLGGHGRFLKTYKRVGSTCCWVGMKEGYQGVRGYL